MKLQKIKLNDFRQFYGTQILDISTSNENNVTLIHAQNGVGKTTILNAILWTFYNKTTNKFEQPSEIVNFEARKDGQNRASVEIVFEHNNDEYHAQRWHVIKNDGSVDHIFRVHKNTRGNFEEIKPPEDFINSVMPRGMAPYFFFDGEHAETFGAEHHHKEVNKAIRNILGCNLAENAITDLEEVRKRLRTEIGKLPDSGDLEKLSQQISRLESDIARKHNRIKEQEDNKTSYEETINSIEKELRQHQDTAEKQRQRDSSQKDLTNVRKEIQKLHQRLMAWPGEHGLSLLIDKMVKTATDYIDEESIRGRIPSPYNENFVKELLSNGTCICGRCLEENSAEWQKVYSLLESAGNAQVMNRVTSAKAQGSALQRTQKNAVAALEERNQELSKLADREAALEQAINKLDQEIGQIPHDEIQDKERSRKEAKNKVSQLEQEIGGLNHEIRRMESEKKDAERRYDEIAKQSDRARPLMERRDFAKEVEDHLRHQLQEHEQSALGVIRKQVGEILENTARRNYKFSLTDDYRMDLLFSDGQPVPRSGGQNQLMSLAFIAALVRFAKLRSQGSGDILIPGLVAPLVLDSPFGQLDNINRSATADFIPKLAEQVVVLVSRGQGDEAVLHALRPRVGAEYVLVSENRGDQGGKPEDEIMLSDKRYPLNVFNCERDMTKIVEVE